ncbi:MAG: repressor LexA, partial [Phototrophicales bacterium]
LVEYINTNRHAPSIRQMMRAMKLKSPAPIQSRLERLRNKGYIDWTEGKARTLRILKEKDPGIPILGAIAAGGLVETFNDVEETLNLINMFDSSKYYALRVIGDSMI